MSDQESSAHSSASGGSLSPLARAKLESLTAFYDDPGFQPGWAARGYHEMLAHYYNLQIPSGASVLEIGCGDGRLLSRLRARRRVGVDLSEHHIQKARERVPDGTFYVQAGERLNVGEQFDCIIVSETINTAADVQMLFHCLHEASHARTRLIVNFFNNLWQPLSAVATRLGMRARQPETNWLSTSDVQNLMTLAGWEPITTAHRILCPFRIPLIEFFLNRCVAPWVPPACLSIFCVARPIPASPVKVASVSVVIPARNEAGNIEAAVCRTPEMGAGTEIIFVEGNSTDHTWAEIQRVAQAYPEKQIRYLQQPGVGKGDAVRAGFAVAKGDILMILDADLTVQPEELPKFFHAIASGRAEFANGVRLVYPMEEEAMRFLNLCANKAFGIIFSWLLGHSVKDTLCGTKVMLRSDYERLAAGRDYFGEFDPFGDFDLLFGAGKLGLSITDIPVRYCDRTYGTTNIKRWKHGWLLLRMVIFAARKLKFV